MQALIIGQSELFSELLSVSSSLGDIICGQAAHYSAAAPPAPLLLRQ
jgi:hypothetical protein